MLFPARDRQAASGGAGVSEQGVRERAWADYEAKRITWDEMKQRCLEGSPLARVERERDEWMALAEGYIGRFHAVVHGTVPLALCDANPCEALRRLRERQNPAAGSDDDRHEADRGEKTLGGPSRMREGE